MPGQKNEAAVLAVMNLHKPRYHGAYSIQTSQYSEDQRTKETIRFPESYTCKHCSQFADDVSLGDLTQIAWPCDSVKVITRAYGLSKISDILEVFYPNERF
jgi:hypothetical protein